MTPDIPPRIAYAPLEPGDEALLVETGERVRVVAVQNQAGDFLVEDAGGSVVTVHRAMLKHWGARRAGCGCCG